MVQSKGVLGRGSFPPKHSTSSPLKIKVTEIFVKKIQFCAWFYLLDCIKINCGEPIFHAPRFPYRQRFIQLSPNSKILIGTLLASSSEANVSSKQLHKVIYCCHYILIWDIYYLIWYSHKTLCMCWFQVLASLLIFISCQCNTGKWNSVILF